MDRLSCNVIYVNRVVGEERLISASPAAAPGGVTESDQRGQSDWKLDPAKELVQPLLDAFGDGKSSSLTD